MKFSTLSLLFVALLALFIAGSSAESIRGQKLATSTNEEATVEATSTDTNADADDDDAALIETNVDADADADDDDDDDALIETNADDAYKHRKRYLSIADDAFKRHKHKRKRYLSICKFDAILRSRVARARRRIERSMKNVYKRRL
jgi:hypothetical protein